VRIFDLDLRWARYIGHAKTHLQHVLITVALNVVRLVSWLGGVSPAQTRPSPFAALMLEAAWGCSRNEWRGSDTNAHEGRGRRASSWKDRS
jgi:hypothetical protein